MDNELLNSYENLVANLFMDHQKEINRLESELHILQISREMNLHRAKAILRQADSDGRKSPTLKLIQDYVQDAEDEKKDCPVTRLANLEISAGKRFFHEELYDLIGKYGAREVRSVIRAVVHKYAPSKANLI